MKGKTELEVIYTILGRAEVAETPEYRSLHGHWAHFLDCYAQRGLGRRFQCDGGLPAQKRFGLAGFIDVYQSGTQIWAGCAGRRPGVRQEKCKVVAVINTCIRSRHSGPSDSD